jgi:hypothetical protein
MAYDGRFHIGLRLTSEIIDCKEGKTGAPKGIERAIIVRVGTMDKS